MQGLNGSCGKIICSFFFFVIIVFHVSCVGCRTVGIVVTSAINQQKRAK